MNNFEWKLTKKSFELEGQFLKQHIFRLLSETVKSVKIYQEVEYNLGQRIMKYNLWRLIKVAMLYEEIGDEDWKAKFSKLIAETIGKSAQQAIGSMISK